MEFPPYMDLDAKHLIDRMLILDPTHRIGGGPIGTSNDISAIKQHPFFNGFDFAQMLSRKVPVPP
jgi:3-phosphoinositide dependent protein kinase-1